MGSDRSAELKLPTTTVAVRLAMQGGAAATPVELFVLETSTRTRAQLLDDVADMLGRDEAFVPVRTASRVRLLGKHAIAWVAIRLEDDEQLQLDETLEEHSLYDRQHRVELELVHGTKLIGTMLDSSPADRPRVIDHLNQSRRFVRLWTTEEHYLINTTQVVAVTELPGSEGAK